VTTRPAISAWSFSRLEVFEKCPYQAKLSFADKIEQAMDPGREEALNRGTRIHKEAELFVKGEGPLTSGLARYQKHLEEAAEHYQKGLALVEDEMAFTTDWEGTSWFSDEAWLRVKIDRVDFQDSDRLVAKLVDYKTGKKDGNEVKHSQQGQLYTLAGFCRYPELQTLTYEFVYLDHNIPTTRKTYTRDQAMKFHAWFHERGMRMTTATEFPPKPSRITCKFCPYGPSRGNGFCEFGVEE
jgi:RecB family exonuclease